MGLSRFAAEDRILARSRRTLRDVRFGMSLFLPIVGRSSSPEVFSADMVQQGRIAGIGCLQHV